MDDIQCTQLAKELRNGTAVIASDGSVKSIQGLQSATQGWVIYGTKTKSKVKGHGTVPGGGQEISSLRPEMGGVLGALVAVDAILATQSNVAPSKQEGLKLCALIDNKAVISRIQKWSEQGISNVLDPDYDLLQASKAIATKHSLTILPRHVKSHQDQDTDFNALPWQAKLNCECDDLAETCHNCPGCKIRGHRHYSLPSGHGVSLSIDGIYITAHMAKAIKEASYRKEMIAYISKNANWHDISTFYNVDWHARHLASKRVTRTSKLTIFKLEFNLFATMAQRNKMDKTVAPTCPRCLQDDESFDHMLKCETIRTDTHKSWEISKEKLRTPQSCPAVLFHLEAGILSWLKGNMPITWQGIKPKKDDEIGSLIYSAFAEQGSIGWGQALRGRLSKRWGAANDRYLQERFNHQPSHQQSWNSRVIFILWRFSIDRWIARNELIYGKTLEDQRAKKHAQVDSMIHEMFDSNRTTVRECDKHLFDVPRETRFKHTLEQKQLWIECVKVAVIGWQTALAEKSQTQASNIDPNMLPTHVSRKLSPTTIHEGRRPRVRFRR
jgi:hypothetical protein